MVAKLNDRQLKFVHLLLEGATEHEAYCNAYGYDYSKMNPRQKTDIRSRAAGLKKHRSVAALLNQHRSKWVEASDVKKEDVIRTLVRVINGEEMHDKTVVITSETGAVTKTVHSISRQWAIEKLCKMLGFNEPQKHEVTLTPEVSRYELEKELARLEELASGEE